MGVMGVLWRIQMPSAANIIYRQLLLCFGRHYRRSVFLIGARSASHDDTRSAGQAGLFENRGAFKRHFSIEFVMPIFLFQ
jgi:hypothetical protein